MMLETFSMFAYFIILSKMTPLIRSNSNALFTHPSKVSSSKRQNFQSHNVLATFTTYAQCNHFQIKSGTLPLQIIVILVYNSVLLSNYNSPHLTQSQPLFHFYVRS